jgi:hypothetical protein
VKDLLNFNTALIPANDRIVSDGRIVWTAKFAKWGKFDQDDG